MRPHAHPARPGLRAAAARLTMLGLAAAAIAVLPAPAASADRFSIGFGFSSGGYKYGHGRSFYRFGYGVGYPVYPRYRYGGFGCGYGYGFGPSYRSGVYYGGSNLGVGLSYRGYYPSYRPNTAYVVQAPVVTERTVVVREPADPAPATASPPPAPSVTSPFPDTQNSQQVAVAQDALALGEYATARQAYARAMAASPGVEAYKIGFGLAAALQGDLRTARFAFERAVRQGGANDFNTFLIEGAAVEDLHALIGSLDATSTNRVALSGLKKLAAANPLPARAYQSGNPATSADQL
ncbi:MAG: hypothetical protein AAF842_09765 [Planctomycetota bacterium]